MNSTSKKFQHMIETNGMLYLNGIDSPDRVTAWCDTLSGTTTYIIQVGYTDDGITEFDNPDDLEREMRKHADLRRWNPEGQTDRKWQKQMATLDEQIAKITPFRR